MSDLYQSLTHSEWDCKYHVVFVPKRRRKAIFGQTRRQLGAIFHALPGKRSVRFWKAPHAGPRAHVYCDSSQAPSRVGGRIFEG